MTKKSNKKTAGKAKDTKAPESKPKAKEAPKKEAPKKEAPKKEAPKKEAPKKEAPKKEAASSDKGGAISSAMVKELREKTGVGIMDCKQALQETGGSLEKAIEYLRKKGLETAKKKSGRTASEGRIHSYIHSPDKTTSKLGVLLEIRCETDFVAKTPDFQQLATDICMQIAASNPMAIDPEGIPAAELEKEKDVYRAQMKDKPANKIEQIIQGKLKKYYQERCLLQQAYVKDPQKTVEDIIKETIAKMGENIQIKRFVRFELGDEG